MRLARVTLLIGFFLSRSFAQTSTLTQMAVPSPSPSLVGQPVTLQATVTPVAARGNVTFLNGATILGTAGLNSAGQATLVTSLLPAGKAVLRAVYAGGGGFSSSASGSVGEVVGSLAAAIDYPNTFTIALGKDPLAITVADVNGDGKADLVVTIPASGTVGVLLGGGFSAFEAMVEYAAGKNPVSVAVGDFNEDGRPDLAVVNAGDNTVSILTGYGDGTFQSAKTYAVGHQPVAVVVADFDGDGRADLAVANTGDNNISFLRGNRDGTFQSATSVPAGNQPSALLAGDFNGDGHADLAVTNAADNNVAVLLGLGGGTFQGAVGYAAGKQPVGLVSGDFDENGIPDLVVLSPGSSDINVLLGKGNGTFQSAVPWQSDGTATAIAAGDIDGDGHLDLFTSDSSAFGGSFLYGAGDGTFPRVGSATSAGVPGAGIAAGSFRTRGITDIAITTTGGVRVEPFAQPAGFKLTLTASLNPVLAGQPLTLTVSANSPATGAVSFSEYNPYGPLTSFASATLDNTGHAQVTTTFQDLGEHIIQAFLAPPNNNYSNSLTLRINPLSGGLFQPPIAAPGGQPADLNGDGKADLIITRYDGFSTRLGNGDGTFQAPQYTIFGDQPYPIVTGDLNGDRRTDVIAIRTGLRLSVLLGRGDGTFQPPVDYTLSAQPISAAIGDFNHDGKPDVIVTVASGVVVLLGNRDGSLQAPVYSNWGFTPGPLSGVSTADFNGDGKWDVAIAAGDFVAVALSNGDGTFRPFSLYVAGNWPNALVLADFNNDGHADMAVTNYHSSDVSVFLGNGDGSFQEAVEYPATYRPNNITAGDFNHDGKLDLAVNDAFYGPNVILLGNGDGTFRSSGNYQFFETLGAPADFQGYGSTGLIGSAGLLMGLVPTTVALTSNANPAGLGQAVTLTATVQRPDPTGTVTFFDGPTILGSPVPLTAAGQARLTTTLLKSGRHSLRAIYGGSLRDQLAVSPVLSQAVLATGSGAFGRYQFPIAGGTVTAIVKGDFNGDGRPDLALGGKFVTIVPGNGDGTFQQPITSTVPGLALAVADFDGDGRLDIASSLGNSGGTAGTGINIALGNGDGTFQKLQSWPTTTVPAALAAADFNLDGRADLVFSHGGANADQNLTVLLGNGDGTFQPPVDYPAAFPASITPVDLNGDGKPDIVLASGSNFTVLLGNGDGSFQPPATYGTGGYNGAPAIGDLNGDGNADLVTSDLFPTYPSYFYEVVSLGNGKGGFLPARASVVLSQIGPPVIEDFNGDGKADVAGADGNNVNVLFGNGDGTLQTPSVLWPAGGSPAPGGTVIETADLNGDGRADLIVGTTAGLDILLAVPPGCTVTLAAAVAVFDDTAHTASVTVTPNQSACQWSALSDSAWATITSVPTAVGGGTIQISLAANPGAQRIATISVIGRTIQITQRGTAPIFGDVSPSDYFFDAVNLMSAQGITAGCSRSPALFCPNAVLTRGQLAVLLARALLGTGALTYTATPWFTDVPATHPWFQWIQKLRDLGIISGCTATTYCPDDPATRGQVAAFLVTARYGSTPFTAPAAPYFTDVPSTNPAFNPIQKMKQSGLTGGCTTTTFCPDDPVTRGQAALLIERSILNQLLPAGTAYLTSAVPAAVKAGQALVYVLVTGVNVHFGSVAAAFPSTGVAGPGVTVVAVGVSSFTSANLGLKVDANATPGPRTIVILTGTEEAVLPNGLVIQ